MRKFTLIAAAVVAIATAPAIAQTGGVTAMKSEPGKVTVADAVRRHRHRGRD